MKKFVKLSLVAAVAVAGLSTANAAALEEAIKGVDISGTMVYRLNSYEATPVTTNTNYYKLAVNVSSPVNEDIKANIGVIATTNANGGFATTSGTGADAQVPVYLAKANFSYSGIENTTVIVGKQGITTPFSVGSDSDNDITTGTGLLAVTTVGPVTLAGGIFNNVNDDGGLTANGQDLGALGAMAKVGPVALDVWYAALANTFTAYSVGAKASFDVDAAKVTVDARHTSLTEDSSISTATTDDNSLSKIMVSAKAGIFNAYVGYGVTGKENAQVTLGSGTAASAAEMVSWNNFLSTKKDANMVMVGAGAQVTPELNAALKYSSIDEKAAANDAEEIYFEGKWTPSKNFYTYLRAGQFTSNTNVDSDRVRVQVQYSF